MKYISFVIPCYNSEKYMEKCIDSLLIGKDDVEIIIIDDGSKDETGKIADIYQKRHPKTVKVIHQENGGYGEGINQGLKVATGKYFKIVDSDDWLDEKAYKILLKKIKNIDTDLIITNYVYTYANGKKNNVIDFNNVFEKNKVLSWDDMGKWKLTQYPSHHSMMYKKSVLDKTKIKLIKHCLYEDNLFIYLPLVNTNSIYYIDIDLYRYFIGREDQSMNKLVDKSGDHIKVARLLCNAYDITEIDNENLRKLMRRECIFVLMNATVFTRLNKVADKKEIDILWNDIKEENPNVYKEVNHLTLASLSKIRGPLTVLIIIICYKIAHSIVKFN